MKALKTAKIAKGRRAPTCHVTMPSPLRDYAVMMSELESARRGEYVSVVRLFREAFVKVWGTPELEAAPSRSVTSAETPQ